MKKLKLLLFSVLGIFVIASCDESNTGPVLDSNPGTPSITSPESGQSYTLNEENAEDTLLTMEWTAPDYGFAAAPEYIVEMGAAGQDFADATEIATVNTTSYSVTVGIMNGILLSADIPTGQQSDLELRVSASISDSLEEQVSDPITLGFTPYSTCNFCPEVYVPGNYQPGSGYGAEWEPADAPPLATVDGSDQYEGYVYMAGAAEFKFTAERNWNDGDWGDDGADASLDPGGANIAIAEGGYYKIDVDLNGLSYTVTDTEWGLVGDATGSWDDDQDMTYDPDEKVWGITTDLVAGEVKFRANDAWDIEYGDNEGDGTLEPGGGNIAIDSDGNYTVELDLSEAPYTYSITQN